MDSSPGLVNLQVCSTSVKAVLEPNIKVIIVLYELSVLRPGVEDLAEGGS